MRIALAFILSLELAAGKQFYPNGVDSFNPPVDYNKNRNQYGLADFKPFHRGRTSQEDFEREISGLRIPYEGVVKILPQSSEEEEERSTQSSEEYHPRPTYHRVAHPEISNYQVVEHIIGDTKFIRERPLVKPVPVPPCLVKMAQFRPAFSKMIIRQRPPPEPQFHIHHHVPTKEGRQSLEQRHHRVRFLKKPPGFESGKRGHALEHSLYFLNFPPGNKS